MDKIFDPKCEHFDPYECWIADCEYLDEATYGDPNDEGFEDVLYCSAPADVICPLLNKKVENT